MRNFLELLLRVYSFFFHLALGVFLVAMVAIDYGSHRPLNLDMLPFSDEYMLRDTLLMGLSGIACTLLALTRSFKFVFFLWTALALYLMIKWFFFSDYSFETARNSRGTIWLTLAAAGAFVGAWWSIRKRKRQPIF